MRRSVLLAFLGAAFLGTGLHFLYEWRPLPLFGLLAPVNESVWEHLKLLYWPFLAGCAALAPRAREPAAFWGAACAGLLIMPPVLLGVYYTGRYGLGIQSLAFEVGLYYLVLGLGFFLAERLRQAEWTGRQAGVLVMLAGLWGGALLICSCAPLELPIFLPG